MSIPGAKIVLRASAAAALLLAFAAHRPAEAQIFGWSWGGPPPQAVAPAPASAIVARLAARGWRLLALRRNGGVYIADVSHRGGHRRHLILDAFSGAILQVFAYAPPRPAASIPEAGPTYGAGEPGLAPPQSIEPAAPTPRLAPHAKINESKSRRAIARREEPPAGSREAIPGPAAVAPAPSARMPSTNDAASPASSAPPAREEAAVAKQPEPHPVAPPRPQRRAAPPAPAPTGPGYANGVPINPLD